MSKETAKTFRQALSLNPQDDNSEINAYINGIYTNAFTNETRNLIYKVMSIIGTELEEKFPEVIDFKKKKGKLIGREKSPNSLWNKIKGNIEDHINGVKKEPADYEAEPNYNGIRRVFDTYGFYFICPRISEPDAVFDKVISHLKEYVIEHCEKDCSDLNLSIPSDLPTPQHVYIAKKGMLAQLSILLSATKYSKILPCMKRKVDARNEADRELLEFKSILDDITNLINKINEEDEKDETDSNMQSVPTQMKLPYYRAINEGFKLLSFFSYKQALDEKDSEGNQYVDKRNSPSTNTPDEITLENMKTNLVDLKEQLLEKCTNKQDLALGDLMFYDVLLNSDRLRELGVTIYMMKHVMKPNGYAAINYVLKLPNGVLFEIQVLSQYRYKVAESGLAAHANRKDSDKERHLPPHPRTILNAPKWFREEIIPMLPKYFTYIGNGKIYRNSTVEDIIKYFQSLGPNKVKDCINYIKKAGLNKHGEIIYSLYGKEQPIVTVER